MRKIFVGSAVLLLAALSAAATRRPSAPDVVFTGRVLEAASGQPLRGAQVTIEGTEHGTLSDAGGRYLLAVPMAEFRYRQVVLAATLIGYERAEATVRVTADTVRTDLRLRATTIALDAIVPTDAGAAQIENLPVPPTGRGQPEQRRVAAEAASRRGAAEAARRRVAASIGIAATNFSSNPVRAGGAPNPNLPPGWNTESYDLIEENPFLAAARNPLSTFSIDVDRASYSNIRRFLLDGQRPPKDAVRIEEMINYFTYAYPEPGADAPFSITTEVASAPWRPEHRLVRIGLHTAEVALDELPPNNLVFLLDVSGSMRSPAKLPLVKQSMRLLVNELRPQDRVAIVVYAGAAGLVLPSTPGDEKTRILDAIAQLEAGGSTAGGAGIRLAYDVARRNHIDGGNNRVILATDGDFNIGVSSDAEMVRLIEEKRRQGTFLTVLGFGTGNLKDSKMEKLADHGNGNYAYIDSQLEARKVLVSEMGGTLLTVAKDVKLQIEFNPARVLAYRLIGYENRLLAAEDFNDDTKDAGELGAGHSVTALYEVIPAGIETDVEIRGVDSLRYQTPTRPAPPSGGEELAYVKIRYKTPTGTKSRLLERPIMDGEDEPSADFTFAAAVAGFGMLLRDSEHSAALTVDDVVAMARGARGADVEGYRAEFVRLAERFRDIERGEAGIAVQR